MSKRNNPFNLNIDSYIDEYVNDSKPTQFSPYREKEEEEIKEPLTKKIKAVNNQKSNKTVL